MPLGVGADFSGSGQEIPFMVFLNSSFLLTFFFSSIVVNGLLTECAPPVF